MSRRSIVSWLLMSCVVAITSIKCLAQDKPNVLLICIDDLKPTIHCFGDSAAVTPNMDRLAARGVRFDRAYCNQAVCSPSRNALLTSLRPQTLGIYDLGTNFRKSRPEAVTVGQMFKSAGYETHAMGKIFHVGHGNQEDDASWTVPHFRPKATTYAKEENAPERKKDKSNPNDMPKGMATESADVADETYQDGQVAAEAVQRLEAFGQSKQPFLLCVGFIRPHLPFVAPQKYWDMHDPAKLPQPTVLTPPAGAPSYAPQFGGELRAYRDMPASPDPIDADATRHLIHGYYAATSYTDAQIGKVLDALVKTGLSKNTIVVLWGDHGWHLGDHGMWCKHTNYEQAARIPVIVALPGAQGHSTNALIESVDILPTLAELTGLKAPAGIDGRSFTSVLKDPQQAHRDHSIHVYPRNKLMGRAVRTERYRLVEWKTPGEPSDTAEYELYDYEADPLERSNLAQQHPEIVTKLLGLLAKHPEAKPQVKAAASSSAPSTTKPPQDRNAMFDKRDKDQDQKLTLEEFLQNQPDQEQSKSRFSKMDKNGDQRLSREEFVSNGK